MIVIKVKENESIDRALKRYKKKFQQTGTLNEVRSRSYFEKPSVARRNQKIKAIYRQKMQNNENI
ncbi:30S ribosomal protein S21 [Cytophagaceae bacterium ABcell3]|nr:30S ribosomal protein S21 [Cytophagaceae bacterium ABcell3]